MANSLSSILTYDQPNPHRPVIAELGGGAFQDHPTRPPDPTAHPSAGMFNQATKQVVALARVAPSMKLQVEFIAGSPVLTQLVCLSSQITLANFAALGGQVLLSDVGLTLILFPPALLPPQTMRPSGLTIIEDVEVDRMRVYPAISGWLVKTKLGSVGVNAAFSFQVN